MSGLQWSLKALTSDLREEMASSPLVMMVRAPVLPSLSTFNFELLGLDLGNEYRYLMIYMYLVFHFV